MINDERSGPAQADGGSLSRDLGVVVFAGVSFFVLAPLGAALVMHFSTPEFWIGNDYSLLYWIRWGARLAGRWSCDFLAGVMLGAWLRRINPWHVWLAIVAIVFAVVAANRAFLRVDEGRWVAQLGFGWVAFQLIVQIAAILGMIALGVRMGRRWKASRERPMQ